MKKKIIDSFLFFQEIDLLKIRLDYLDSVVDKFIIVESGQTFKGNVKPFNFEANKHLFEKYLHKIYYYKIKDIHNNYVSLCNFLSKSNNLVHKKILGFMENHSHYDKLKLNWVLDSYHRECIHIALSKIAKIDDIVILSDLDEIPHIKAIEYFSNEPISCRQNEFRYYLNLFHNSNWIGSKIANYHFFKDKSLNNIRRDNSQIKEFYPGGYHFTSVGGIELIRNKVMNWTHQEYNIPQVINNIEINIRNGRDIFYRIGQPKLKVILLNEEEILDQKISKIISFYSEFIIENLSSNSLKELFMYRYNQIKVYLNKVKLKFRKKFKFL